MGFRAHFAVVLALVTAVTLCAQSVSTRYVFKTGADGDEPNSLISAQDGNFYGTTAYGGGQGGCKDDPGNVTGCGTVFRLDASGNETVVYSFTGGADGAYPTSLIQGPDGKLYGTTAVGGGSLNVPSSSQPATCTDPNSKDAQQGAAEPCCVDSTGNNVGCGTLFRVDPSQSPAKFETLASFMGDAKETNPGAFPGSLIAGVDSTGKTPVIYGLAQPCSYCGTDYGFLFSFVPSTNTFAPLPNFGAVSQFSYPNSLVQGECASNSSCDVNLYGTALLGGGGSSADFNCLVLEGITIPCGGVWDYQLQKQQDSTLCNFGFTNNNGTITNATGVVARPLSDALRDTTVRQPGIRFPTGTEWSLNMVPISLTEGSDGSMLGTTPWGCFDSNGNFQVGSSCAAGSSDIATVFQCQPTPAGSTGWTLNTIYSFTGTGTPNDGGGSLTGLLLASDGNFYGSSADQLYKLSSSNVATFLTSNAASAPTPISALEQYATLAFSQPSAFTLVPNWLIQGSDSNFYGTSTAGGNGYGAVFESTLTPASTPPPVQLVASPATISYGSSATLTWTVQNAFSLTAQQCFSFVQNGAAGAGNWSGVPPNGVVSKGVYSGSTSITPTGIGKFTYALTCGGMVSGFASVTINPPPAPTVTLVASATSGISYGQAVSLTASANPVEPSGWDYSWTIDDGPTSLVSSAPSNAASGYVLTASSLPAGQHSFTAAYSSTLSGLPSGTSAPVVVNIGKAATATTLVSSTGAANVGGSVSWTATVASQTSGTPTGSVQFLNGASLLGTVNLSSGDATYSTSSLGAGTASVTAVYSGDGNFDASTSAPAQVVVTAPAYTLSANPNSLSLTAGQSGTTTITLTPVGGFSGSISLSCTGLPQYSTCIFNPSSLAANGSNTAASTTLTIETNVSTNAARSGGSRNQTQLARMKWIPRLSCAGLLILFSLRIRTGAKSLRRFLNLPAIVFALLVGIGGCGGGPPPPPVHNASSITPAGTYTITISASSGAGATAQSVNFTVVVNQ